MGFGFSGTAPNRGMIFADLKDFRERKGKEHLGSAVVEKLRGEMMAIPGGLVIPFNPPAVEGASEVGGFTFELEDLGRNTLQGLANTANQLIGTGNADKNLAGLFTSFTANDPQILVKIDRDKAKSLQIPISQITDALQVFMGSVYVNDFDFNNRSYRVYLQADQKFRSEPKDIRTYYLRSDSGKMIPLDNVVEVQQAANPQVITHFNLFRSAEISGSAAPGVSTGQGLEAMEAVAKKILPRGMSYEWSGLSLEEIQSSGKAGILFALGLVFVYLTLAAQYESYVLPFIVLLGVPVALLGALGAMALRGLTNDVYCQIGLVMLIGLASKNAILIVEFAEQLQDEGARYLGCRGGGRANPFAADLDDIARVHSGCGAVDAGARCRSGWARVCGDNGVWRDDRRDESKPDFYSHIVCRGAKRCAAQTGESGQPKSLVQFREWLPLFRGPARASDRNCKTCWSSGQSIPRRGKRPSRTDNLHNERA